MQDFALAFGWYSSSLHLLHLREALNAAYLPGEQSIQEIDPASLAYLPVKHAV